MNPNKIIKYIDWILILALIGLIIYLQLNGYYNHTTIKMVEVCNGIQVEPINLTGLI